MFGLFVSGNPVFMSVMTIILILIFVAAWKAPAWVKEAGIIALVIAVFAMGLGLYQMFDFISEMEDPSTISMNIIANGVKVTLIPMMYGMIIYVVSLVIRIIQKPRI